MSRFCYETDAHFFRDQPELVTRIKTYFVPDDRKWIPFWTIFSPNNHIAGDSVPFPGIDQDNVEYYNGADDWGCPGETFVGTPEQWQKGGLISDEIPAFNPVTLCPEVCGCPAPPAGPCIFVPYATERQCQVVVSGATGGPAVVNGSYLLDHTAGCQWHWTSEDGLSTIEVDISNELFPIAYIACFLLFNGVSIGFYEVQGEMDPDGTTVLFKGNLNPGWPDTITIEFPFL